MMFQKASRLIFAAIWSLAALLEVSAMQIEGYAPSLHDRFASGFTSNPVTNPVANNGPEFLGSAFDLSGIPWNAADRKQSFVFLSRKHYLFAKHFGPASNLQYFSSATGLGSVSRGSSVNLPESDIGIARLTSLIPASAGITTYPLLDLPATNSYVGRDLLMAGWFARFGKSEISSVLPGGKIVDGATNKYLFEYEGPQARADFVTLEGLDSGSPSFIPFDGELTLTGNHFYIINGGADGGGDSFLALPEVVTQINSILSGDGFALRFRTEPANQWTGSNGSSWSTRRNWTAIGVPSATQTVGFGGNVTNKTISLDSDRSARGMLFTGAIGESGYTFQAGKTLTVNYVGIRNEAPATQTFLCSLALAEHQHWVASAGNLQMNGTIDLGSKFLNLGGSQTIVLGGNITGSGGLSVQEGITRLGATASYNGPTYLYGGEMHVHGPGQLPPASPLVLAGGQLRIDAVHINTGGLRLLDNARVVFAAGAGSIEFAPSAGETWTAGSTLSVLAFDESIHQLKVGNAFNDMTPSQRAAISFAGRPAFHDGLGIVRAATSFEQWLLEKFPNEAGNPSSEATLWGANATPAGDAASNLLKYALNLEPLTHSTSELPQASLNDDGILELTIRRNSGATDVTYRVEVSDDLTIWKSGSPHTVVVTDEPSLLVVRDATLSSASEPRFMRLVVELGGSGHSH
jgi:hypothetical protein